uniref:Neur_chan_LBD domain-containing protein n=1 Tax=Ascaris lumbricoides TaxID=6252 RepID=A0A0M3IXU5_ASCLU
MRRACACDSKLRQLVIGTYYRDRDTVMRPAETTIVDDVLAMFFNVRHWKSFDPKKIYLEEIKVWFFLLASLTKDQKR